MFEYMKKYVGRRKTGNFLWTVQASDVAIAEERLGYALPDQLQTFYREVGAGFFCHGVEDGPNRNRGLVNRILGPIQAANILLDKNDAFRPPEGFLKGVMPFFDVGSGTFLVLKPRMKKSNRVYWPDGKTLVAEDLYEFFERLHRQADFYREAHSSGMRVIR